MAEQEKCPDCGRPFVGPSEAPGCCWRNISSQGKDYCELHALRAEVARLKAEAEDVRALDEWKAQDPDVRYWVNAFASDGQPDCRLLLSAFSCAGYGTGSTPAAARHAAANWVRSTEQKPAGMKGPLEE